MTCGSHERKSSDDNCVCAVLREIARVQDLVSPENGDCIVSCEKSIEELLAGTTNSNGPNTIPVILYCGCDPFEGFGVRTDPKATDKLDCVNTFLFKVKSVDKHCCAKLELLETKGKPNPKEPCEQFRGVKPEDLEGTGICITVDLHCFCAVTCLDPITL